MNGFLQEQRDYRRNGVDGVKGSNPNGINGYMPAPLTKKDFYLSRHMAQCYRILHWPLDRLDVESLEQGLPVDWEVAGGPFDRTLLRAITLPRVDGGTFAQLFVKIFHPGKTKVWGTRHKKINLAERVDYEAKNLEYWNRIDLPSPFYFDTVKEKVPVIGHSKPLDAFAILTSKIQGPTHDLDVIAINELLSEYDVEDVAFRSQEDKEKIGDFVNLLKGEKKKIISSIFRTQMLCQLLGTYHIKDKAKKLGLVPVGPSTINGEVDRLRNFMRMYHLYDLVRNEMIPIEEAEKISMNPLPRFSFPYTDRWRFKKKFGELELLIRPILKALYSETNLLRYVHGDEYLHHYAYKAKGIEGGKDLEGTIHSVMFDSNDAKMGFPEEGLAKTLLSPILTISPKETEDFLRGYHDQLPKLVEDLESKKRKKGIKSLSNNLSYGEFRDRFDLFGVLVLLSGMGLKATDKVANRMRHDSFSRMTRPYPYVYSCVNFPDERVAGIEPIPKNVRYIAYSEGVSMPSLRKGLEERINSFLGRKTQSKYGELKHYVSGISDFLEKYQMLK